MRQDYVAAGKAFVDYAGQAVPVINRRTGEVRVTQIFGGVLGGHLRRSVMDAGAGRVDGV